MPKFAANLSMLFSEVAFPDRFRAAAEAGFRGVECQFPYAWDQHELATRLDQFGLALVLHNLPTGDWHAGERGIACHPGRSAEFRRDVARGIEYAQALGCPQLNCLAGRLPTGVDPDAARQTLVENLRYASAQLERAGIGLVVEPINTFDVPGFFLCHTAQALDLIAEVGSANLRVQYDMYHMQRMEGELANTIDRNLSRIGHIQLADNPGRHEPGTGEINFGWLLRHLDETGYDGWVGCEYRPAGRTEDGLGWMLALT